MAGLIDGDGVGVGDEAVDVVDVVGVCVLDELVGAAGVVVGVAFGRSALGKAVPSLALDVRSVRIVNGCLTRRRA